MFVLTQSLVPPPRLPVLLPRAQPAPSGRPHSHPAAGGRVRRLRQHHAGGVPEKQPPSGALRELHVHPARHLVLPGRGGGRVPAAPARRAAPLNVPSFLPLSDRIRALPAERTGVGPDPARQRDVRHHVLLLAPRRGHALRRLHLLCSLVVRQGFHWKTFARPTGWPVVLLPSRLQESMQGRQNGEKRVQPPCEGVNNQAVSLRMQPPPAKRASFTVVF